MSIAWNPPECHVENAMFGVSVGLWAGRGPRPRLVHVAENSWFCGSLYFDSTVGLRVGDVDLLAHPHAAVLLPDRP